jgi:hypothetical protein
MVPSERAAHELSDEWFRHLKLFWQLLCPTLGHHQSLVIAILYSMLSFEG